MANEASYAARLLANRMWYQKNKAWKKKYNKQYYLNNVEKWNNYYRLAKNRRKDAQAKLDDMSREVRDAESRQKSFVGPFQPNSGLADKARENLHNAVQNARSAQVKEEAVKLARQMAIDEYNFYMDTHKRMKLTDAWANGADMIKDAGRRFISDLLNKPLP